MSCDCVLGDILAYQLLLGRFTCSKCTPFGDNGSHCGSVESHSRRNGFVICPRLKFRHFLPNLLEFVLTVTKK
uniref:Uncharacterized protein n=1 Tax=Anguilla anguilla TaxID=7936 RepID=A0A0E9S951_ANGAN